ncbi:MAG: hypothetical protein K8S15_06680 [Candidatus Aegiribacteria sp.]|nr:hypothetical protein [Candidatus Aegiribacteria sp.]
MKYFIVLALTLAILSGCIRDSNRIMDQDEMDRIGNELAIQACLTRIDSVGFEIEGMLYHESIAEGNRPLEELLPDSMPVCPVSGLEYIIGETSSEITITCPSGHGSLTLEK